MGEWGGPTQVVSLQLFLQQPEPLLQMLISYLNQILYREDFLSS
jgi:hypothetical protein